MRSICLLLLFTGWLLPAAGQSPWLLKIRTGAEFQALAGPPLVAKYGHTTAVKVLLDLQGRRLYYINHRYARLHFEFARQYLGYGDDLGAFNNDNYSESNTRRFVLANVNYFPFLDTFALEFSAGDDVSAEHIREIFLAVRSSFFAPDRLALFANTALIQERIATLRPLPPTVTPDAVYNGQTIQPVSAGTGCGILRSFSPDSALSPAETAGSILLLEGSLEDLPVCAAAVVTRLQTPLSHVSVLAHNRGTPLVALIGHAADPVRTRIGQDVCLEVSADTFRLLPNDGRVKKRSTRVRLPAVDLAEKKLVPVRSLSTRRVAAYGAKACSLGEIARTPGAGRLFSYPKGAFAIPFAAASGHFKKWGIDSLVSQAAADTSLLAQPERLQRVLRGIRKIIRQSPVDSLLLAEIRRNMIAGGIADRARFRSSANAEDVPGFNGAGLYDSRTGSLTDSSHTVEDALRTVWASLFREKAWLERAAAGIPQRDAHMAVLVHEGFPDESANGVAITRNLYRPGTGGFVVNVQQGETPVVSPPPGVRSEQFITYYAVPGDFYQSKKPVDYITYSSLSAGIPLLSLAETRQLTQALARLKARFFYHTNWKPGVDYNDAALDVEFKFVGTPGQRRLVIKQARPYR